MTLNIKETILRIVSLFANKKAVHEHCFYYGGETGI